jgi:hypothetical protein
LSPFYRDEHLYVDLRHGLVTLDCSVLTLTNKEYCLLLLLVQHAGETLPRKTLEMRVWGHVLGAQARTLDIHIRRLRKKLGYTESSKSRRSSESDTVSCQHIRLGVGACSLCRRHRQLEAGYRFRPAAALGFEELLHGIGTGLRRGSRRG